MDINPEIIEFYKNYSENERLSGFSLEKLRTQELILRFLPGGKLKILDIGGGTGIYSFWLNEMGHSVYLVDASEKHIQQAKEFSNASGNTLETLKVGDARKLEYDDDYFDAVLMLGPLYHLTEQSDRNTALLEAKRVLKSQGILFTAAISRYASMMDGFHYNLILDPEFVAIMNQDLSNGQHRNKEGKNYFTTSFFHLPEELETELSIAGYEATKIIAIESFAETIPNLNEKLEDIDFRNILFQTISRIEQDKSILGISPHLMGIGIKP